MMGSHDKECVDLRLERGRPDSFNEACILALCKQVDKLYCAVSTVRSPCAISTITDVNFGVSAHVGKEKSGI